jgi:hypothetical protein
MALPVTVPKKVKDWFETENIPLIWKWPGCSPDLNPIQHAWAKLKKEVSAMRPTSRSDIIEQVKIVWSSKISVEYCTALVSSMPSRIESVLRARGGHIRS